MTRPGYRWSKHGFPMLVRETGGHIRGYLSPGMIGHGVAETEADALALIGQLSRHASRAGTSSSSRCARRPFIARQCMPLAGLSR